MSALQLIDRKTKSVAEIICSELSGKPGRILVVGCGSGAEAAILAQCWGAEVVGIDVVDEFDPRAEEFATLQLGDAMALDFADEFFDMVYSYHALEHIPDPMLALSEMKRVLRPSGSYWVGVPNKQRLLGYIGSKDATFRDKIAWNVEDWKSKLAGKFENELGAHAGFTRNELRGMLEKNFSGVKEMSDIYFSALYARYGWLVGWLAVSGLSRIAYPSIYFMGKK